MIIGGDFNKKGKTLLKRLAELSGDDPEEKVKVSDLNETLEFGRKEIKNLMEYLENQECVKIESIGGPLLYGHISITEKGIQKARK